MPVARKLPDDDELLRLIDVDHRPHVAIAEEFGTSRQAVYLAVKKARSRDILTPWPVLGKHRAGAFYRAAEAYGKQSRGLPLTGSELRDIEDLKVACAMTDGVMCYDREVGFYFRNRCRGDVDIVVAV